MTKEDGKIGNWIIYGILIPLVPLLGRFVILFVSSNNQNYDLGSIFKFVLGALFSITCKGELLIISFGMVAGAINEVNKYQCEGKLKRKKDRNIGLGLFFLGISLIVYVPVSQGADGVHNMMHTSIASLLLYAACFFTSLSNVVISDSVISG